MEAEPTKAYVYQPLPDNGEKNPRIFAVGGPGSKCAAGETYTRGEAQAIADSINQKVLTSAMLKALGSTPSARSAINLNGR